MDRSDDYISHPIVIRTASLVRDLDFAATVWSWRLIVLPVIGQSNDLGTILEPEAHISNILCEYSYEKRQTHRVEVAARSRLPSLRIVGGIATMTVKNSVTMLKSMITAMFNSRYTGLYGRILALCSRYSKTLSR